MHLFKRINIDRHVLNQIRDARCEFEMTKFDRPTIITMHSMLIDMIINEKAPLIQSANDIDKLFGMKVKIDNHIEPQTIKLENHCKPYYTENFCNYNAFDEDKLPKKFIINDGATILFWSDGTKTIVKKSKEDIYDPIKSFLWAYFQKKCGLSKNKANKFLEKILN